MAKTEEANGCKIMRCTCKHEFQDKEYGKGMRVFNPMKISGRYRCTVCGREVNI